jgi:hypothetical protein
MWTYFLGASPSFELLPRIYAVYSALEAILSLQNKDTKTEEKEKRINERKEERMEVKAEVVACLDVLSCILNSLLSANHQSR